MHTNQVDTAGIHSLSLDGTERCKQIAATILKEAEFIRNEILAIGASARTLLIGTVAFIGGLLTATAKWIIDPNTPFNVTVVNYKWLLLPISFVGVITCLTFLRLTLGSHAGIFNAANYYRNILAPHLNVLLNTGNNQILSWESWLSGVRRQNRWGLRNPGETIIFEPLLVWLIGIMFASWGFIIEFFFDKWKWHWKEVSQQVGARISIVLMLSIFVFGLWFIIKSISIENRHDHRPGLIANLFHRR